MDSLILSEKISAKEAASKISAYVIWGEHDIEPRPKSPQEVYRLLRNRGINPEQLAEKCRDYKAPIPFFQNLFGTSWTTHGDLNVAIIDKLNGQPDDQLVRSGKLHLIGYIEIFRHACLARDRAIKDASYTDFLIAITLGIASMEGFFQYHVESWNKAHLDDQLIDNKENKVSFGDKIDKWIPKISGRTVKKKGSWWNDYKLFIKLRDDQLVHPKRGFIAIEDRKLVSLLNKFKNGIGGMMAGLHQTLGIQIPAIVIDSIHYPRIKVANQNNKK